MQQEINKKLTDANIKKILEAVSPFIGSDRYMLFIRVENKRVEFKLYNNERGYLEEEYIYYEF